MNSVEFANKGGPVPFVDLGRSYEGWDCYGVIYRYFLDVHGITIPDVDTKCDEDEMKHFDLIKDVVKREIATAGCWVEMADGVNASREFIDKRLERVGDVLVMRMYNRPIHVGVIIFPDHFMHAEAKVNTVLGEYRSFSWNKRIIGVYRHKDLVNAA